MRGGAPARGLGRAVVLAGALAGALAGCAAYQPGSFSSGEAGLDEIFPGERVTVGCLDVAIQRRPDQEESAVLQYRFGNRCNRAIEVDLQRVVVVGRSGDGREVALAPYDPRRELRPARLGGRLVGGEAIAYPTTRPADQVCVDAASIVHAQPARWLCFAAGPALGQEDVLAHDLEDSP